MSAFALLGQEVGLANGFFLGTLFLDIIADSLKRHYPYATDEISTVPEIRFPIKLCNMALEMVPHLSGSCRFQIINQPRYIECRVNTDKKMDMILLTTEFFQSAIPAFHNTSERGFKKVHDLRTDYLTAVFGDNNYV